MFSQKTTDTETQNIEDLSKIPGKTSWHICMYISFYGFFNLSLLESGMFVLKKEDDQQAFLVCSQLIEPLLQK